MCLCVCAFVCNVFVVLLKVASKLISDLSRVLLPLWEYSLDVILCTLFCYSFFSKYCSICSSFVIVNKCTSLRTSFSMMTQRFQMSSIDTAIQASHTGIPEIQTTEGCPLLIFDPNTYLLTYVVKSNGRPNFFAHTHKRYEFIRSLNKRIMSNPSQGNPFGLH